MDILITIKNLVVLIIEGKKSEMVFFLSYKISLYFYIYHLIIYKIFRDIYHDGKLYLLDN